MTALVKTFGTQRIVPFGKGKSVPAPSPFAISTTVPLKKIEQLPAPVDLILYAGDDFSMEITLSPVDLTGASAEAQIRPTAESPTISASFACDVVGIDVVKLTLLGTDTQTLKGGYVWDCQVTNSTGAVLTPVAGTVDFTQDVTR